MIILFVEESESNITRIQLPHVNMVVVPRPIECDEGHEIQFLCERNDPHVTRTDTRCEDEGWDDSNYEHTCHQRKSLTSH